MPDSPALKKRGFAGLEGVDSESKEQKQASFASLERYWAALT
jgi:hypothetical protein